MFPRFPPPLPVPPPPLEEERLDLAALLALLWQQRWRLILAALLGLLAGWIWCFHLAVPRYTATATLLLDPRLAAPMAAEGGLAALGLTPPGMGLAATEAEVLRSRNLLSEVVTALDLAADPEFNPALRPAPRLNFPALPGSRSGPGPAPGQDPQIRAVTLLRRAVAIRSLGGTAVLDITVTSLDAQKSAHIADAIALHYMAAQRRNRQQSSRSAGDTLRRSAEEITTALATAENRLQTLRLATTASDETALDLRDRQITELHRRLAMLTDPAGRAALAERLQALEHAAQRETAELTALARLTREVESQRAIHDYVLARIGELSLQEALQQPEARLLAQAVTPADPATPRPELLLPLCAVAAVIAAAGLALIRDARHGTVDSTAALAAVTGLPVLAELPRISAPIAPADPASVLPGAEDLAQALGLWQSGPALIAIAAALPDAGRQDCAASLAALLGDRGRKIRILHENTHENIPPESLAMLRASAMENDEKLLLILPPILCAPAARRIAADVDRLILCARWRRSRRRDLTLALERLSLGGPAAAPAGIVLTGLPPRRLSHYPALRRRQHS